MAKRTQTIIPWQQSIALAPAWAANTSAVEGFPDFVNKYLEKNEVSPADGLSEQAFSKYWAAAGITLPKARLFTTLLMALFRYCQVLSGDAPDSVYMTKSGMQIAEWYSASPFIGEQTKSSVKPIVSMQKLNQSKLQVVKASIFDDCTQVIPGKSFNMNDNTNAAIWQECSAALLFGAMPTLLHDGEFKSAADTLIALYPYVASGIITSEDERQFIEACYLACSNYSMRVQFPDVCGNYGFAHCGVYSQKPYEINNFGNLDLNGKTYVRSSFLIGSSSRMVAFEPTVNTGNGENGNPSALAGAYEVAEREFSDMEQQMIPELPPWYIMDEKVICAAKAYKETYGTYLPFNVFAFYGESGAGKTEGCRAFASLINRPYTFITCSANSEMVDIVSQLLPHVQKSDGEQVSIQEYLTGIPSAEDMAEDPEYSYQAITGTERTGVTSSDCMLAAYTLLFDRVKQSGGTFVCVESELIKATRYGWVCEIQEPTVILNPGVLVGLNGLLDRTSRIALVTGEIVERHPDTVYVFTTNLSYAGCRDMNASLWRRCNMSIKFEYPDEETIAARVIAITGMDKSDVLQKMIATIQDIRDILEQECETNASAGICELCNWVQLYMRVTQDPILAAKMTILGLVSRDPEIQEKVLTCIENNF